MGIKNWFRRATNISERADSDSAQKNAESALKPAPPIEAAPNDESAKETIEAFEVDEICDSEPEARLSGFDMTDFWHDTRESKRRHESPAPERRDIRACEEKLGYKLPPGYVELMKTHNGGLVNRCWFPLCEKPKQFSDYIQITDILGIGCDTPYSLCGRFGSDFLMENWGHNREIGVAVCNTLKPGRALVFLDYRECGRDGEPAITYAEADTGCEKRLADTFEDFIRNLCDSRKAYSQAEAEAR